MLSHRLAPALTSVGLGFGILFAAPFSRDVTSGIGRKAESARPYPTRTGAREARLSEGEPIARVTVARVGLDSPVLEGIEAGTLARGAGHVPRTALPGEEEKSAPSVIAVPRGRCAEAVGRLRLGEWVRLTTPLGPRRYRVADRRTLEPTALRLGPATAARINLIAPYPSDSPGPAPLRLVVALERANEVPPPLSAFASIGNW